MTQHGYPKKSDEFHQIEIPTAENERRRARRRLSSRPNRPLDRRRSRRVHYPLEE